jgi:hypothetical protein
LLHGSRLHFFPVLRHEFAFLLIGSRVPQPVAVLVAFLYRHQVATVNRALTGRHKIDTLCMRTRQYLFAMLGLNLPTLFISASGLYLFVVLASFLLGHQLTTIDSVVC